MNYYYDVILLDAIIKYDSVYTYKSDKLIEVGTKVFVTFSKNNRIKEAVVIKQNKSKELADIKLKSIIGVSDFNIGKEEIALVKRLSDYYLINPSKLLGLYFIKQKREEVRKKIVLLKEANDEIISILEGKNKDLIEKYEKEGYLRVEYSFEPKIKAKKTKYIYIKISNEKLDLFLRKLDKRNKIIPRLIKELKEKIYPIKTPRYVTKKHLKVLEENSIIASFLSEEYRYNPIRDKEYEVVEIPLLSEKQNEIYNEISKKVNNKNLLIGVNASGKNEVAYRLVKDTLLKGEKIMFLVPEAFHIMQVVKKLKSYFGDIVGIFYSKNTNANTLDELIRLKEGKTRIIVGTSSALFKKIDNLGLIVVDEVHEASYISVDNAFSIVKATEFLADIKDAKLLYLSPAPNLKLFKDKSFKKHYLMQKYYKVKDNIKIIEKDHLSESMLSSYVKERIDYAISNKKKTVIMLNRLGYDNYTYCFNCYYNFKCQSCGVTLTEYKNDYRCVRCNYKIKKSDSCPKCFMKTLRRNFSGIKKLYEELKITFQHAKILLIDSSTLKRSKDILNSFEKINSDNYDIIIGTHLIQKSLNIKNLYLSINLDVDSLINLNEYTASIKAYQSAIQLLGRVSRQEQGEAIIETRYKDHYVFKHIMQGDFISFSKEELAIRKATEYPPYYIYIKVSGFSNELVELKKYLDEIRNRLKKFNVNISEVYLPFKAKTKDVYKMNFIISTERENNIEKLKKELYKIIKESKIYMKVEIEPSRIMY